MIFPLGPLLHNTAAFAGSVASGPFTAPVAFYEANQQTEGNGNPITTLTDRTGNGWHFSGTGTTRPTLTTNSINGKSVVSFDGVDDFMDCALGLMNSKTAGAYFMVVKAATNSGSRPLVAAFTADATLPDPYQPFGDGHIYENFGTTARKDCGDPTPDLSGVIFYGCISGPSDFRYFINNTTLFSTATNTVGFGTSTRWLGKNSSGVSAAFDLAELYVLDYVPTAGEIAAWVAAANTKYGTSY